MNSREVAITSNAAVIGRRHLQLRHNGQDFAIAGLTTDGAAFGLVADGCGSKFRLDKHSYASNNEVGAKLLCQFAAGWLQSELHAVAELPPVVERLHTACLDFLQHLVSCMSLAGDEDRTQFIATNLLTTMLGFAVTAREALFFWQGDGYLSQDGAVIDLSCGDEPDYLAYRLLEGATPSDSSNAGFNTRRIERSGLQQLAVATDGWTPALFSGLPPAPTSLALQRWMNVQARHPGQFDDDGAIALCVLR